MTDRLYFLVMMVFSLVAGTAAAVWAYGYIEDGRWPGAAFHGVCFAIHCVLVLFWASRAADAR